MEKFNPEENIDPENRISETGQTEPETASGNKPPEYPKISPLTASFIGLAAVFILYQIGGSLMTIAILGLNIQKADPTSLRLLTAAGQILFILLPALLLTRMVYSDVTFILRFRFPKPQGMFLFIGGLLCLTPLLQSYLYIQNAILMQLAKWFPMIDKLKGYVDQMDKMIEESYSTILASHSILESALIVIVVAVVPAICEELFFRGYVQKGFEFRYRPFRAALITAVFFGLYHFHPYQIVPLVALGLYFGYAVYLTDSIFTSVFLHFLNNLFAVVMYFIYGSDDITAPKTISAAELRSAVIVFFGLLMLFSFIIFYTNRVYSKKNI